jgi:hypothetical protein
LPLFFCRFAVAAFFKKKAATTLVRIIRLGRLPEVNGYGLARLYLLVDYLNLKQKLN